MLRSALTGKPNQVHFRAKYIKRTLAPEALYFSESYDEHPLRARRRVDGQEQPEGVHDLSSSPDASWDRAPDRIREIDPLGDRALALLQEIEAQH